MVKVEMAVRPDESRPAEYIWMTGQLWPVPPGQDSNVLKIEAFGEELKFPILTNVSGSRELKGALSDGPEAVLMRSWYLDTARYLSEQMRAVCGAVSPEF